MPVYIWEGKNRKNEKRKGEMEASTPEQVTQLLLRQKITATKVKKKPKDLFENVEWLQPKVKAEDLIVFTRQFSTMIDAGLPIVQSLEILATQEENPTFKKIIRKMKSDVESGETLAESIRKHPKVFDELYVNMVAAGETGGILDTILQRLALYMEKADRLKKKVKGALTYPIVTLVIAIAVVAVILIWVIPVFQGMFADFGKALPLPTQFVIALSEFLKSNIFLIAGALFLLSLLVKYVYSRPDGRMAIDRFLIKAPVFGDMLRKVSVAKFTRTMGTMIASGVAILDALDIVGKTSGNRVVETAIYDVRSAISEGETMSSPLTESGIFPGMVCSMINVGESTGALDTMLVKIADFYEEEVDQSVENLTGLIEPFMLVFLGVVIGGLVVSMYLPIFTLAGAVTG